MFSAAGDTETVYVMVPPARDRFGDPVPATGAGKVPIHGCLFAPGPSTEALDGANQVAVDGTVYAPTASVPVTASDRLRIRGEVFEVVGKPQQWARGVVLSVRRVTG